MTANLVEGWGMGANDLLRKTFGQLYTKGMSDVDVHHARLARRQCRHDRGWMPRGSLRSLRLSRDRRNVSRERVDRRAVSCHERNRFSTVFASSACLIEKAREYQRVG